MRPDLLSFNEENSVLHVHTKGIPYYLLSSYLTP